MNVLKSFKISRWILQVPSGKILGNYISCVMQVKMPTLLLFSLELSHIESKCAINTSQEQSLSHKKITIPRLQLLAATIGSRLLNSIVKIVEFPVISWIKRQYNWKPFFRDRVAEIRKHGDVDLWYHIPGPRNIAHFTSRGCTPQQLLISR